MLIALMTLLFLGGAASGTYDYFIEASGMTKKVIVEKDRRDAANETFKSIKKRIKGHNKDLKGISKSLKSTLGDHQATDTEFDAIWDQFVALNTGLSEDLIDLRFELKSHVTREEWSELFPLTP